MNEQIIGNERTPRETLSRRQAAARMGITAAAAAFAAPAVIDTFGNPAGAAGASSALLCNDPASGQVTVPANRDVYFDLGGGGAGGASTGFYATCPGGDGGSGAQVTGMIAQRPASYVLKVFTGTAGAGAPQPAINNVPGGAGGTGYQQATGTSGQSGGNGGKHNNTDGGGGGGGGGGCSAITGTSIEVIASGGGGGGGAGGKTVTSFASPSPDFSVVRGV